MGLAADGARVTLHRFFVAPDVMRGERFPLPAEIAHQVNRVLRLQDGERLVLLDGSGEAATVRLADGACVVESRMPAGGEPVHRLVIWQALLRGDHLEPVIRQGTEIGVAVFRLFVSERCVAREISPRRLERLQAVAREAAEQSERGMVPPVAAPVPLRDALEPPSVLLYERADGPRLGSLTPPASLLIGPEGGFSPSEVAAAEQSGVTVAGLGPRILRSESVALAAAAVVLSRSGDFA
jgi:16S rRNA (uracil1498-N3)-methyltransferase